MKTPQNPSVLSDVPPTVTAAVRWTHFRQRTEMSRSPSPPRGSDHIHRRYFIWELLCHQDTVPTHLPGAALPKAPTLIYFTWECKPPGNIKTSILMKMMSRFSV